MKIPTSLKLFTLATALTAFYSFVGQAVPQMEVHPPSVSRVAAAGVAAAGVADVGGGVGVEAMVKAGQEIFEGKGTCTLCHTIGKTSEPLRFPDLAGIGARASQRIAGMDDVAYLTQTLYEPNAYVVEGFPPGMLAVDKPPINLTEDEVLTVIAYLQSLGGTPSVTMATKLPKAGGASAVAVAEASPPLADSPSAPAPIVAPPSAVAEAPAVADETTTVLAAASVDVENGKKLYALTCVACHGADARGNKTLNAPRLDVQEPWYISRQLKNFATGVRGTDPRDIYGMQMRSMALTLRKDEDMSDIAAYLSSLSSP